MPYIPGNKIHVLQIHENNEKQHPNVIRIEYNPDTKKISLYFDEEMFWNGDTLCSGENTHVQGRSAFKSLIFFYKIYDMFLPDNPEENGDKSTVCCFHSK